MAKKRIKKLLASALAVSMAATLLPAAVMAGPNEEVVLEQQAMEEDTTSPTVLLNKVMKAKASAPMTGAELLSFNSNMKAIEDVSLNETKNIITVYANKDQIVSYEGSTGQSLPFFALVLDCAGVNRVESPSDTENSDNSLDNGDKWPQCHTGVDEMAEGSADGNYISLWCLKTWWDADSERVDENGRVGLRLVKQDPAGTPAPGETITTREYQDISIAFEDAKITEITGEKSIAISGNTTLTAVTIPKSASANVTWKSLSENIAKVDSASGKVTGVASGNAIITATMASGVVSSCEVIVTSENSEGPGEEEPGETTTPSPTPGEIQTPSTSTTPTPDASVTPEPSETPDASITPDPSGTPEPTGTPGAQVTPTPEPSVTPVVEAGTKVETSTGTVVVTDVDKKEVAFDSVDKTAATVKVPGTVKINGVTYKVTKIEDKAFANGKKLTTVTIPAAVTEIGKAAFKNCTKLTTVVIPKNVTTLGSSAFAGCTSLKKVTVKSTKLKVVTANAFKGCTALTTVTLPKTVTTIKKAAFAGCTKMKTLTIKATTLKVTKGAFKSVPKTATIKVPKSKVKAFTKKLTTAGFKGKVKAI